MLDTSIFDNAKPHVEAYLKAGYDNLDTANMLKKLKKYTRAIPEYVSAYEEIGSAHYIINKISDNEEITEEDLQKHINPGSHLQKILSHYITRRDQMSNHTSGDFEKIKKSEVGKQFPINYSRENTIKKINERISIYSKLHKLRQTFDYSHDRNGQIMNHDYNEEKLKALCYLLESECLTSYYEVKLGLEMRIAKVLNNNVEMELAKITTLQSSKKLKELSQEYNMKDNKIMRLEGLEFIKSF